MPGLGTRYRPDDRRAWVKIRYADTADVRLLGLTGTARRPRTALLEPADGCRVRTSKLETVQARHIADSLSADPPRPGSGKILMLPVPLEAEARVGSTRHGTIRFVRVKAGQG